jgi:hypothetical protein
VNSVGLIPTSKHPTPQFTPSNTLYPSTNAVQGGGKQENFQSHYQKQMYTPTDVGKGGSRAIITVRLHLSLPPPSLTLSPDMGSGSVDNDTLHTLACITSDG